MADVELLVVLVFCVNCGLLFWHWGDNEDSRPVLFGLSLVGANAALVVMWSRDAIGAALLIGVLLALPVWWWGWRLWTGERRNNAQP